MASRVKYFSMDCEVKMLAYSRPTSSTVGEISNSSRMIKKDLPCVEHLVSKLHSY
jgi:hypothetical protein